MTGSFNNDRVHSITWTSPGMVATFDKRTEALHVACDGTLEPSFGCLLGFMVSAAFYAEEYALPTRIQWRES